MRWRTRTGAPWRDVPDRYGPWTGSMTCSGAGSAMAPGPGSSLRCRPRRMPRA
ncbi:hypothetical protein [Streptomyces sp. NBC_00258]|uniref:hypothetical protein n=1 Tax=Streptomyces sp. NBC_00258 TaxID=2903642 RepID=UPI002E2E5131|nr:hypothetical protein [Streptomyces sp. NBC_00258]